ncbi:Kynureninase [Dactylella cylindrospora]|nr:Kynureninase [Dactylella cylindrospora]
MGSRRQQLEINIFGATTRPASRSHFGFTGPGDAHLMGSKNISIYLCGNSLGLQPKETQILVSEELQVWAHQGVFGHHMHPKGREWIEIDERVTGEMAKIVGALQTEVAVMGTLTSNLHFLMASFYRPTEKRFKILIEDKAFPSDYYAVESQVMWHGLDPSQAIISLSPRTGNYSLQTDDILKAIDDHAETTALLLFSGVQYYTGQLFEIEKITRYAKDRGVIVGWDLAHAAGNVLLKLHDWQVDFAAWCSYKYLNSGPGGIGAIFVHENQSGNGRLTGWWGHNKSSRFLMDNSETPHHLSPPRLDQIDCEGLKPADCCIQMRVEFVAIHGAGGFQHSNPSVLATVCLLGSLRVFAKTTMQALVEKSRKLTGFLEELLLSDKDGRAHYEIITPKDPLQRGAQLSLLFKGGIMEEVHRQLELAGIVVDERKPDVIRVAPAPLYNTYQEVFQFSLELQKAIALATRREA